MWLTSYSVSTKPFPVTFMAAWPETEVERPAAHQQGLPSLAL